jgi:hypothetical protein
MVNGDAVGVELGSATASAALGSGLGSVDGVQIGRRQRSDLGGDSPVLKNRGYFVF